MHRATELLIMTSRRLSLNEVMALLEGSQEGDVDDRMEVVTQGSDDDLDAHELGDVSEDEEDWNGMQSGLQHYLFTVEFFARW